jgi:DNA polymerase III epsilon subunit-like protein
MKLLIFDTETTGLPKARDTSLIHKWPYIVQLSYIIYDTELNEIIKIVDNVIKMKHDVVISNESINIHGITNEISNDIGIPIFNSLYELYIDICNINIDIVIAHNITFDYNMLIVELNRIIEHTPYNIKQKQFTDILQFNKLLCTDTFKNKMYCTMKSTTDMCNIITTNHKTNTKYKKFPKLSELHFKLFNIIPSNLHNSLNDVLICLRCYYKIIYNSDICDLNKDIYNSIYIDACIL